MSFEKLLMITVNKKNWPEFKKFIIVGILNTLVGYGLFAILIYANIFYLLSLTISHVLATFHSYLWNRLFTFKSAGKISRELPKFAVVYSFIYVLNFFLLYLAVDLLKLNVLISQLFILGFVTIVSFLGQRYWTFKGYKMGEV